MAQKSDFKTVETDLDELEEKIRKHRRKIAKRIIIVVAAVVALFLIVWLWMALRTYKSFDVKNSVEQKDKSAVSFVDFCGAVVEYSNDGVLYTASDGNRIWNQAFEMSSPQVVTCESFMTIYDRGGTVLYIMDKNGVKKEIGTSWPIIKACIASQGTVAVLVSENENYYVKLYDVNGKELASGEFFGEQKNIPVDIALSYDAKKLAVDMIDVSGGKTDSVISFYNFGSVGQNEIDNNVGTYKYENQLIPEIAYVSDSRMIAVSDQNIMVFDGSQKPKIKQIKIDPEKIGEVIGQRGKTINTIIEETGVKIDIDDEGRISICGVEQAGMDKAIEMINMIVEPLEVGKNYHGKVVKVIDCGAIVSLAPNKDGLIHISKLSDKRVAKVEDVVNVGDEVDVKVIKIDERAGRISLSLKDVQ